MEIVNILTNRKQNIYVIGDVHIGSKNFNKKAFEKMINKIKNDRNAKWIGIGDYIDSIVPGDPRYRYE